MLFSLSALCVLLPHDCRWNKKKQKFCIHLLRKGELLVVLLSLKQFDFLCKKYISIWLHACSVVWEKSGLRKLSA